VPWGRRGTYREVALRLPDNAQIVFDDDGRLHFAALEPEPEPASLLDLRAAVNALLPRVDPPEVLVEVFSALYMLILLNQLMESHCGLSHADRRLRTAVRRGRGRVEAAGCGELGDLLSSRTHPSPGTGRRSTSRRRRGSRGRSGGPWGTARSGAGRRTATRRRP
jgi:hypothetical protein